MNLLEAKIKYIKHGPNDEFYTPDEAIEMILPFIPEHVKTIWECTAIKESRIIEVLRYHGYEVITSHIADGKDFLKYEPDYYDLIVDKSAI